MSENRGVDEIAAKPCESSAYLGSDKPLMWIAVQTTRHQFDGIQLVHMCAHYGISPVGVRCIRQLVCTIPVRSLEMIHKHISITIPSNLHFKLPT